MVLNNDVILQEDNEWKGDSTEIALKELATELDAKSKHNLRLKEIPFDSDRKLMTTFHAHQHKIISFTKGAADILLDRCVDIDKKKLYEYVDRAADDGMRVIGFSYRYWNSLPDKPSTEIHEKDMHFLGLVGMIDAQREEVLDAVVQCKRAGIVPVMITGDHLLTAKSIGQRTGIVSNENDLTITGRELSATNDNEFNSIVENVKVYARVSPEQKLRIVKALQQRGQFVAMTGDGVNDAPSLKSANIGIAMAITGTDVSKEAADMILLDDNFSTIVIAIKEGRRIYDNILKFIKYLMTTNSGEILILMAGPFFGLPVALLPIHILWINLVSDGLPAISLSFEKPEKGIMERPPRSPRQSVFANGRGIHIVWVGILIAIVVLFLQAWAIHNDLHWRTIVFNVLCFTQLGHALAVRSETQSLFKIGIFSNKYLSGSILLTVILQIIITYYAPLQSVFKTDSLEIFELVIVFVASFLVFFAVEIEKCISGRRTYISSESA